MRVLFFLHNISKTRHFDDVLAGLAERGHSIVLAAARQRNRPLSLPKGQTLVNRRLIARGSQARIEVTACPVRRMDEWRTLAPSLRHARDYLRFSDSRYAHARKLEHRSAAETPKGWLGYLRRHGWVHRHWRGVSRALAAAEALVPSDRLFDLYIQYENPDLVLVTPLVDYGSYQADVVKSAHRVGVPVVFAPFSWDNLTNRGLIHVMPDRVLAWNEIQKREAVELHGVSPDRVIVVGAPRFDEFFRMRASCTREEFCRAQGLEPAQRLVLYLCSSEFVAPREIGFIDRWIQQLRASSDPAVRGASLLVRPHPAHLAPWRGVDLASHGNVAVWHEKAAMNADQGLYDSLALCDAVVGLNTSAMLEAGILGKPVHTIVTDEFAGGQEQTLHFHYLRASNGGLVLEANGLEAHAAQLAATFRGEGAAIEQARRFVSAFVRPRGIDVPVAPLMVEEIERAARIAKHPRRQPLWQRAVGGAVRWALRSRRALTGRRAEVRA